MKAVNLTPVTPFGEASFALDKTLEHFKDCTSQLERTDLNSDKGYEKALSLLSELDKTRDSLKITMGAFSKAVQDAKLENEAVEVRLASLIPKIQLRQEAEENFKGKFKLLAQVITALNQSTQNIKGHITNSMPPSERNELDRHVKETHCKLETLNNEAAQLVQEARSLNMKGMEREADGLRKSLSSLRNKLQLLLITSES